MDRTQRLHLRSAGGELRDGAETQPLLAVLVATALVIALSVYGALQAAPHVMAAFAPSLGSLPQPSSALGWMAPAIAVGVFLVGASLAAFGLTAFVQGVRREPFRFLAPVLIGFASMVMAPLELERTMGAVPASIFAALSALCLLGGGVLLQVRGVLGPVAGSVLLSLPVLGLVLDRVRAAGLEQLLSLRERDSLLAMLVLALTSAGVGLIAYIGRPSGELQLERLREQSWKRHREQLAQALERVQASELRAREAEARASELEQLISEHCDRMEAEAATQAAEQSALQAEAAALTGSRGKGLRVLFALSALVIGASGGAVALHAWKLAPLQAQLGRERAASSAALAAHARSASEARTTQATLDAERAQLRAALHAERTRAEAAVAQAKLASEKLAALQAQAVEAAAEPPPKKRTRRTSRTRATPKAKQAPQIAERAALRESVDDDPIGGL